AGAKFTVPDWTVVLSVNDTRYHVRPIVCPEFDRSNVRVKGSVISPRTIFWPMLAVLPEADEYVKSSHDLAVSTPDASAVREVSPLANDRSPVRTEASVYSTTCHAATPSAGEPTDTRLRCRLVDGGCLAFKKSSSP